MSDTALNKIIQYGTNAARLAFTPSPAAASQVLYIWYVTDSAPDTYVWDGSAWAKISGGLSASNQVVSGSTTLLTGTSSIVPVSLEIAAGIQLEIGGGAIQEILGSTAEKSGKIDLSVENSMSISRAITMSTEGSIDWFVPATTTNPVDSTTAAHAKYNGGWILRSFRWLLNGGATLSTFSSVLSMTSTAAEDMTNGTTLSSFVTGVLATQNANGYGWSFRVPAGRTQRVLRIYAGIFTTDAILTVSLRSGAVPTKTYYLRNTDIASASRQEMYKIAYYGDPGDELLVNFISTNKQATTPNLTCIAVTLGTV